MQFRNTNIIKTKKYFLQTFCHYFYLITVFFVFARFLLASFHIYKQNSQIVFLDFFFRYDASLNLLTTSVAYFRQDAFPLFCLSLIAVIALTIDWLLSTKYGSLFFGQSYDLLVVNTTKLILNNGELLKFNFCLKKDLLKKIINYLKVLRFIWKGRFQLNFAKHLTNFEAKTCTRAVRGRAFLFSFICEFIAAWHIHGTGNFFQNFLSVRNFLLYNFF